MVDLQQRTAMSHESETVLIDFAYIINYRKAD